MPDAALPPLTTPLAALTGDYPPAKPRVASVLGLGHQLPPEVLPNGPIAERVGIDDDWIVKRTGIHTRRRAADDERLSDLAVAAARKALGDAGVSPEQLDLVLVATMTPDEICPNTAPLVAHALGAERAAAIDVGAACSGWLSALQLGAGQIETGRAQTALVVGAEVLTRLTNWDDRKTAALFGDGAGAVVLGADGEGAVGPIILRADGGLAEAIVATHEERFLRMDGHSTFQAAVKVLTESTKEACRLAGRRLDDIDLFVYHQANGRILRAVAERLDVPPARVADYIGETGNTSAASIPLTMSLAREDGRLRAGHQVLVGAVGGGFTWGAGVIEWGLP
jgi:3-oxoacyl-[acyl-carrier-protein] synthase-3